MGFGRQAKRSAGKVVRRRRPGTCCERCCWIVVWTLIGSRWWPSAQRAVLTGQDEALLRAHVAAPQCMRGASGGEIWDTIAPSFHEAAEPAAYQRAVERYHRLGVSSSDATLPRTGYDRPAHLM